MTDKYFFPLFALCSVLLFSYSLVQENTVPEIRIISPDVNEKLPRNSLVPYNIEISDKEDGYSEYDEIDENKVLLTVAYFSDSLDIKKKKKEVVEKSELLPVIQSATCFTCHKIEGKLIGPSFSEISKRYNPTEENKTYLIEKISRGSQGVWSDEIMPAQPKLEKESISQILDWVFKNAQSSNYSFYSGTEGTFKTVGPSGDKSEKEIYLLYAQYTDRGLDNHPKSSKKGKHIVVLNIE